MYMQPSLRKGAITDPASVPFINYPDSVYIQDDQFPPEYLQDLSQYTSLDQARLQSPFQYRQNLNFVSPPSSVPSSPTSSAASSVSRFPATTAASADYSGVFDSSFEAPSMTPASSYNPEIHVNSPQQTYLPQYNQQFVFNNSPMLAQQQYIPNNHWDNNLAQAHSIPRVSNQYNHHQQQQTPSSSSGRSPNTYRQNAYSAPTKPLPTPVHTPIQQNYLTPQVQKNDLGHDNYSFVPEQNQQSNDHSHAPSVSTVSHNSPVTPQNQFEEVDEKPASNDYNGSNLGIPKLNRTITDVYQDELFNPTVMQTPQAKNNQQNLLAPSYHNIVANRLQAANQGHLSARAQSPVGSIQRDRSPFRQNSPMAAEYENDAFRQQHALTSVPTSQPGMMHQQSQAEPKTISPKDAVLSDFNEGDDHALPISYHNDFNVGDAINMRQDFQPAPSFPSMDSFSTQFNQPQFNFNQSQPQSRRQSQQNYLHHTPDFPASMPRFESTGSDVYNEMTSPTLTKTVPVQRPQNTSADGGTYTCTYHGCTQRFETPAKLQKHKREAHRQTTPGGHLVGRGDAASRNSQAGPHKCTRPNPSTGKPCNSVFSRPYDLTRHEDTIHNARKQKVRCHLCTEEKTFSRNDALTRHMRVVHPEVDWPGKQRRRGRE